MKRQVILVAIFSVLGLFRVAQAEASDKQDVVAVVRAFNDAGNKGDRAGYASYCTADAVIVDHIPPYMFSAPSACAAEYDAVVAWGARSKVPMEGLSQTILDPVYFERDGDRAYAVFPLKAWFKQNGRKQVENSYVTAVLRRQAHSWRIASLIYTSLGWAPGH